jgi:hypothetical protein
MTHKLRILNSSGDSEIQWDEDSTAAKEKFLEKKAAGFAAFGVKDGKSDLIKEFDVDADEIVMVRQVRGG